MSKVLRGLFWTIFGYKSLFGPYLGPPAPAPLWGFLVVVEVVHGFLLIRHEENNFLFLITPTHRDCTDVEKVLERSV